MQKSFRKYERIPHLEEVLHILDNPVEVYEKIDGGNVQVRKIDGRIICGSRANFLTREEFFHQDWFKYFQRWALGNYSFYNLPENLVIYGEWTAKHTLEYKPEFTNKFFLLDVFDLNADRFIPYEQGKDRLLDLGVEDVISLRNLFTGYTSFEELEKMIGGSDYRIGDKEGLVIKNYLFQTFAKLWATSVKKKGVITLCDIHSIFLSLQDAGETITKERLIEEVERDLEKSGRNVSKDRILVEINKFYKELQQN